MPLYLPLAERRQAMKLTDKCYCNQVFKKVSFYNGGLAIWWTKKTFERCDFEDCDFTGIIARGCRFIECVFKRGKLQHFYMGSTTLVMHRKTVYRNCTFERVKLRDFGIADFYDCSFINCDFQSAFITASFTHCNFIGKISDCVFCGPQYKRYYYMNQLNYWVSNKGRLHDVDFTKATLTDVDFRGAIDLSTTKFPTDYKINR